MCNVWLTKRAVACWCALVCAAALITCDDGQNPFADSSNARAHVLPASQLSEGDTVQMFTTYRLAVGVLVAELVDSFRVHADSSYRCADSVVRAPGSVDYVFELAFADTGLKTVSVTTYRSGGDLVVERTQVRVVSPLNQVDLQGNIDDELNFSTSPVGDSVWYHWCYGDGVRYPFDTLSAQVWQTRHRIAAVGALPGRLWVSLDHASTVCASPGDSFTVNLEDENGPEILCLNDVHDDTIRTGVGEFSFLVRVDDPGAVKYVSIDGRPASAVGEKTYRDYLTGLDSLGGPRRIIVDAADLQDNRSSDTFFVAYTAGSGGQTTRLEILDADSTRLRHITLMGVVYEYGLDSVRILAVSADGPVSDTPSVGVSVGSSQFSLGVDLEPGRNDIIVRVIDSRDSLLTTADVTVYYADQFVDTRAPVVQSVLLGGIPAREGAKTYVPDTSAQIVVQAYDFESGVRDVLLGGVRLEPVNGVAYQWSGLVASIPSGQALGVSVVVIDSADNKSTFSFLAQKNRVPAMPAGWVWPDRFFASVPASVSFVAVDDGDQVSVSLENAPAGMGVQKGAQPNEWSLTWTPTVQDTGLRSAWVVLSDSANEVRQLWQFRVLRDSTTLVQIATQPSSLPRWLEATRDSLVAQIALEKGTGTAPFTYTARLTDRNTTLLQWSGQDTAVTLRWLPIAGDTGVRHVEIMVTDAYGDRDVMHRDIEVVPANADPCSLVYWRPQGVDTTAGGELDMRTAPGPIVLRFAIDDSDHPYTERYVRSVNAGGYVSVDTVDSAMQFSVYLDTMSAVPHDTVVVRVSDRTGSTATVRVPVLYRYAKPRLAPSWQWPSRLIAGTTVALACTVVAPYHGVQVSISGSPAGIAFDTTSAFNVFRLRSALVAADSGIVNATVRIADAYNDTVIDWRFVVLADSGRLVSFASTSGIVAPYAEVGSVFPYTLATEPGSGVAPLRYRTWLDGGRLLGDTLRPGREATAFTWTPLEAETGIQTLMMTVRDSLEDADTLVRTVRVVPRNSHACALTFALGATSDTTADGAIDLSSSGARDTVRFTIADADDPVTEHYDVYITRSGMTSSQRLDSSRAFELEIVSDGTRWGADSVEVVVIDATGTSAVVVLRLWYGSRLPTVAGGAHLALHAEAVAPQLQVVTQRDTQFVNVWRGNPAPFAFTSNTYGASTPPLFKSTAFPPHLQFTRAWRANLIAQLSRNVWSWVDSAFTVFVVARFDAVTPSTNYTLIGASDSQDSSSNGYLSLGVCDGFAGVFTKGTNAKSTIAVQPGTWYVVCYTSVTGRVGGSLTTLVHVNGAAGGPVGASEQMNAYHTIVGASFRNAPVNCLEGDIAEIVMYRGALQDSDRRQIEYYLAGRHGITLQ